MTDWIILRRPPLPVLPMGLDCKWSDVLRSPYDVPHAVRAFKTRKGRLRFEFKYPDGIEPPGGEQVLSPFVSVFEGKHSARLVAFELDASALGPVDRSAGPESGADLGFRKSLDFAWERIEAVHDSPDDKTLFEDTRAALRARERDLLTQLAGRR